MESQQALDVKDTKRFLSQDPELYLTVSNTPTEECQDRIVVRCSTAPFGKCIDAYLTPVDAAISAWWSSSQDIEYQVLPSSRFDPSEFVADFGRLVRLAAAGKVFTALTTILVLTEVFNAKDKVQEINRQGSILGGSLMGGVAGSALVSPVCGPGAPICAFVLILVGGMAGGTVAKKVNDLYQEELRHFQELKSNLVYGA